MRCAYPELTQQPKRFAFGEVNFLGEERVKIASRTRCEEDRPFRRAAVDADLMICTMRPANQDQRVAPQLLELIVSLGGSATALRTFHVRRNTSEFPASSLQRRVTSLRPLHCSGSKLFIARL